MLHSIWAVYLCVPSSSAKRGRFKSGYFILFKNPGCLPPLAKGVWPEGRGGLALPGAAMAMLAKRALPGIDIVAERVVIMGFSGAAGGVVTAWMLAAEPAAGTEMF